MYLTCYLQMSEKWLGETRRDHSKSLLGPIQLARADHSPSTIMRMATVLR